MRSVNYFAEPFEFGEDRRDGCGPSEGPRMLPVVVDEGVDLPFEVGRRLERTAAHGLIGDQGKPNPALCSSLVR